MLDILRRILSAAGWIFDAKPNGQIVASLPDECEITFQDKGSLIEGRSNDPVIVDDIHDEFPKTTRAQKGNEYFIFIPK